LNQAHFPKGFNMPDNDNQPDAQEQIHDEFHKQLVQLESINQKYDELERTIQEKEQRFQLLAQNISDIIWMLDSNLKFTYVSPSAMNMTGFDSTEVTGKSLQDVLSPKSFETVVQYYKDDTKRIRAQNNQAPFSRTMELELIHREKKYINVEVTISILSDKSGEVTSILGITRDISERKTALEAIRKSEMCLRQFIEDDGEPVMSVDAEGRILLASKRVHQYVGLNPDELKGKTIWDVFLRELNGNGVQEMKNAIANRVKYSKEYPVTFRGERRWYEILVQPLTPIPGIEQAAQVIAHDITETIKTKTRDKARIKLLNDLRSAHDIDACLECGCRAIAESQYFKRAVMTIHNDAKEIIHLGQVGLDKSIVEQARRGKAPDDKTRQNIMQNRYRLSRSYFIPVESNLQLYKSERYIPPDSRENPKSQAWKNGDELFVPILTDDNVCEGWLSVDTPFDDRRPNIETALLLEEIIDIVTKKIHEISSVNNLQEKSRALEESNIALRTVLSSIEHDKNEIREKVSRFIGDIIMPAVDRLTNIDGTVNKVQYAALKNGLVELMSTSEISTDSFPKMSPRELEICMMIKDGLTSKEISRKLHIALKTVHKHRQFIRQKLGIDKKKLNLTIYLGGVKLYRQQ
jgi:PAS domain S-box-containing protein